MRLTRLSALYDEFTDTSQEHVFPLAVFLVATQQWKQQRGDISGDVATHQRPAAAPLRPP